MEHGAAPAAIRVAPAGTVLRVRLLDALDSARSRPGDRFQGLLDSPVQVAGKDLMSKGTLVTGHVVAARKEASLSLTLDTVEFANGEIEDRAVSVSTGTVARTRGSSIHAKEVFMPANSLVGFTLQSPLREQETRGEK